MCGECCMNPADYNKYHLFEPGLTKADNDSPCAPLGFPTYDSTVTHGALGLKMTLDLYDPVEQVAEDEECCVGACTVEGEEKYYSIDTKHNMCGECCMNPADYNKYHLFEPGLTKADNDSPCGPLGYHTYDSTVTHGAGNIKMTLDLYDPDSSKVEAGDLQWTDCGSDGDIATVKSVSGNPVVGADFDVIAELSLASDVTEGSVNLSGSLNGLNVLNVDQDLCTATDIALPLNAGDMYWPNACGPAGDMTIDVKANLKLSASYGITLKSEGIFCIETSFSV